MIPKKRPRMPQSACFAGNPPYAAHSFKHEDNVAKMVRWAAYYLYRDRLGFRAGPRDLDALDIKGVGLSKDDDVAPSLYPALSSPWRLVMACWPLVETGSGAEPFAGRSGRSRLGWKVAAKADGVCHPSPECGREPL